MRMQGKERKRLKKLAAAVPEADVEECLSSCGDPGRTFLVGDNADDYVIRSWHPRHGVMEVTIDDDPLAEAVTQELLKRGLVFVNDAAARAYAEEHNWPARGT